MTDAQTLVADLMAQGVCLQARGDALRFHPRSAVTPDLLARLRTHKIEVLALLAAERGPDGWPTDTIDPDSVTPCPKCGMLELWQTGAGDWRCQRCDPPVVADRLAELAKTLRRRANRLTGATRTDDAADNDEPREAGRCRCGSRRWRDLPIHGGESIRRDCAKCGQFLCFPVWHGKRAGIDPDTC